MRVKISPAAVIGSLALFVATSGVAVAATGDPLLLGKSNSANKPTGITNGSGTALALSSKAGTPPLTVGGNSTLVPGLNAAKVGGLSKPHIQQPFKTSCQTGISGALATGDVFCAPGTTSLVFTSAAQPYQFVVPTGALGMLVTARGGGGGGGDSSGGNGGAGGGQGAWVTAVISDQVGETYDVTIGSGGLGGTSGGAGDSGTATTLTLDGGSTVLSVGGGSGGAGAGGATCNGGDIPGGAGGELVSLAGTGIDVSVGQAGHDAVWSGMCNTSPVAFAGGGGGPVGPSDFAGSGGHGSSGGLAGDGVDGLLIVQFLTTTG